VTLLKRMLESSGSAARLVHRLRYAQFNSRLLRSLLAAIYREGNVYRVPYGPLRGARLEYDRSINYHEMLGLWELETLSLMARVLRPLIKAGPATVCDIGANIGLYTLWLARTLAPDSVVYAFEPAPYAFERLSRHVALNNAQNVRPLRLAVSDTLGEVAFYEGYDHHISSLNAEWAGGGRITPTRIMVPATTLDAFCGEAGGRWPDFIKIDIEGGGVSALRGVTQCVERTRPLILIESHTPAEDGTIGALLLAHGYEAYRLTNRRWVGSRATTHPDPDGVWGTLLLCPAEARARVGQAISGRRPIP